MEDQIEALMDRIAALVETARQVEEVETPFWINRECEVELNEIQEAITGMLRPDDLAMENFQEQRLFDEMVELVELANPAYAEYGVVMPDECLDKINSITDDIQTFIAEAIADASERVSPQAAP